ncbi:MAG: hypothetical protein K5905_21885 [Roseibium sp.]|uniref:hypothetical protein n=1 Tax=Roseibium sp. TaxID=1936156 RepID=UPI0026023980|nr:hypothetical protein [Roseibium sp.]MCV0428116.1 hypothetical protein [Roseibium sp.]
MIGKLPISLRNAARVLKTKIHTFSGFAAGSRSNTEFKPRQTDVCRAQMPTEQYVSGDRDVTF